MWLPLSTRSALTVSFARSALTVSFTIMVLPIAQAHTHNMTNEFVFTHTTYMLFLHICITSENTQRWNLYAPIALSTVLLSWVQNKCYHVSHSSALLSIVYEHRWHQDLLCQCWHRRNSCIATLWWYSVISSRVIHNIGNITAAVILSCMTVIQTRHQGRLCTCTCTTSWRFFPNLNFLFPDLLRLELLEVSRRRFLFRLLVRLTSAGLVGESSFLWSPSLSWIVWSPSMSWFLWTPSLSASLWSASISWLLFWCSWYSSAAREIGESIEYSSTLQAHLLQSLI